MSFADWSDEELEPITRGLALLGWRPDTRLTSDDALFVRDVALRRASKVLQLVVTRMSEN
jgi:hypothetical protein